MSKSKTSYMLLLNAISCVAVIYLHVNDCFWTYSTNIYWMVADVIESVFYFAVPCFFMMTGAKLIDYREKYDTKTYFIKRIKKTVIPFLVWSMLGITYCTFVSGTVNYSDWCAKNIYNAIMGTGVMKIYWFFPSLFCVYLTLPVFAAVEKKLRKEVFTYLVVAGFVINSLIPFVINAFSLELVWPLSVSAVAGNIIFIPLGYLVNEYELDKPKRNILYIISIAALLLHMLGTGFLSGKAGMVVGTFKGYSSVTSVLYSLGIFVWFRYNGAKIMQISWLAKAVGRINRYTFGIYLIHWFIIDFSLRTFGIDYTSIIYRIIMPWLVLAVAVGILWILKKIPVVKWIVP